MINITEGGVTAAKGFRASSARAGLKTREEDDLALITSSVPCIGTGVFTTNRVKGAPVLWSMERIRGKNALQAVFVNAGIANACAGEMGLADCEKIAGALAERLVISENSVLMASTGRIGPALPMEAVLDQIGPLCDGLDSSYTAGTKAARAILPTDSREKQVAVNFSLTDGTLATIGGCAKGSTCVHPDMCTMLSFLTTDLNITKELLEEALAEDVKETYNMISIDGDMSVNDTVILMANGLAGNPEIRERSQDYQLFKEVLHELNLYLTRQIAADGEGAAKLLCCRVLHAPGKTEARRLARTVISAGRVRKAFGKEIPDWGGVLAAVGQADLAVDPGHVDVMIESRAGRVQLAAGGEEGRYAPAEASAVMAEGEITIVIDVNSGASEASAFGCAVISPLS